MIRKNILRSLHREVMGEALRLAWHNRVFWILAFFAGILQTGGIYDVLFSTVKQMSLSLREASPFALYSFGTKFGYQSLWQSIAGPGLTSRLILGIVLALLLAFCSIIAQGALVAGIGTRTRGRVGGLRQWITLSLEKFWSILSLNIFSLGLLWLARAFVLIPLVYVIRGTSFWNVLGVLLGFLVFAAAMVFLTAVHLFGLQSIVLQNTNFWKALHKAVTVFKKSWLMVLEKGLVLLLLGFIIWMIGFTIALIASIPLGLLFISGLLFHQIFFASVGFFLISVLLMIAFVIAGTFAITFQYAAWNGLSRRLSEGSAVARLHRWSHWLMKEFHLFRHQV